MRQTLYQRLEKFLPERFTLCKKKNESTSPSSTAPSFDHKQMSNILCQVEDTAQESCTFSLFWVPFQQTFAPTMIIEGLENFNKLEEDTRMGIINICLQELEKECINGQWKYKGFFIKGTNATRGLSSKSIPFIKHQANSLENKADESYKENEKERCAAVIVEALFGTFKEDKQHGFILQPFLVCLRREYRLFFQR